MPTKKDPRLARAGVAGYNKPKRTPGHPKKSHIVVAKEGDKIKTIRFGEQGAETAGKPKAGESERMKQKRESFKSRHAKNIAKGKMSAAYWADKVKWIIIPIGSIILLGIGDNNAKFQSESYGNLPSVQSIKIG
jgi:hypothetical protein